jgi:hypothetical protein
VSLQRGLTLPVFRVLRIFLLLRSQSLTFRELNDSAWRYQSVYLADTLDHDTRQYRLEVGGDGRLRHCPSHSRTEMRKVRGLRRDEGQYP